MSPACAEPGGSRLRAVLRQSSSVFSAQVLTLAASVLCIYLVSRLGGAEGKGWIYRIQLLAGIGLVLVNAGLGPAAVLLAREPELDADQLTSLLLWPSLLLGSLPLGLVALARLMPRWMPGLVPHLVTHLVAHLVQPGAWDLSALCAFATLPASVLLWNLSYLYLATGEIAGYNRLRASQSCLFALLLAGLAASRRAGVAQLSLCWMAAMILPALGALGSVARARSVWRLPSRALVRRALGFAWRSHLGAVLQYLQHRTDVLLILWLLPLGRLGIYSLAIGVVEMLWYVPQAVAQVLLPHIAASEACDANRITSAFCRASIAATAVLALTLAGMSTWAIPHLLPAFRQAVPLIWILLPGTVVASVFKVLASDLTGRGQPLKTAVPASAALLFSAAGCAWALPRYGLQGAAVVTSLSYFLNAGIYLAGYSRLPEMDLRSMLLLKPAELARCREVLFAGRGWGAQE